MKKLYTFFVGLTFVLLATVVVSATSVNAIVDPNPSVITNIVTDISETDATLNGMNGDIDASMESFWVSLNPIDTSTSNIPAGVYSTPTLDPVGAGETFSTPLSIVSTEGIITGGFPGNLSITPDTTYYYVAWANIEGKWYHGEVLSFDTDPTPPETATISAKKIVCDNESDLPNWGVGGSDITSTTASSYVSEHEDCEIVPWTFEWSADGVGNPGDNIVSGGDNWNTFDDSTPIPTGEKVWVREQMDGGYIPFTGENTDQNVSAEFYCNTDVLNYDNLDWIDPVVAGETYHCVGFNVLKEQPETKQCDVVSDTTNIVENGLAAVETWDEHPAWMDSSVLGGAAKWIWSTFKVTDPTIVDTKVFVKKFNLDNSPATANIEVAADNGFILEVNGTEIANEINNEFNFGTTKSYVVTNLVAGENTIRMTVKNFLLPGATVENPATDETNPAGALYKLHIIGSSCSDIPDMCLNMNGYQTKIPEGYERDDNGNCTEALVCNPNVNLIQNGDFENPNVTPGTYSIIKDLSLDPGSVLKWLVAWVGNPADGRLGLEIQNNIAGTSYSGSQHAELDGDHPVTIWQDVPTVPGNTYKLDFAYSPRQGRTAVDNEITVKANGVTLGSILSVDGTANTNTDWMSETRTFEATGSTTKIEFTDTGTDTSFGGYLDNVGLYCQNIIPEDDPYAITDPATSVTTNSTTINGTNGDFPATSEAFWWGTTPGGPFVPAVGDASSQYPSGWTGLVATSQDLSAGGEFSLPLASLTPNTLYYYVAWSLVDGTWYPGDVLTFTTLPTDDNDPEVILGCMDEEANNYNPEATEEDDDSCTYATHRWCTLQTDQSYVAEAIPNNQENPVGIPWVTGMNAQCIMDACPNVEGHQSDTTLCPAPTVRRSSSGSGYNPNYRVEVAEEGRVLGATTSCGIYLNKYIKLGDKNNDKEEVKKLQQFLNEYLGLKLDVDGFYGQKTYDAVKAFQIKHSGEVLDPWPGLKDNKVGTGYMYKTTQRWVNMIKCPELNLPMPVLN